MSSCTSRRAACNDDGCDNIGRGRRQSGRASRRARCASAGIGSAGHAIDRFLVYAGDWLNPILVKETRQALKSSQFAITFVLVLVACWIVTIGVVAYIGPRIFYSADGGTLLAWYYAILALPLMVVVPLAAFRSLAAEREDNTYDLLSITALKPRQIISGKLGSSIAQMAVYFSAITPCLAFTYLLRGVDLPTIAMLARVRVFLVARPVDDRNPVGHAHAAAIRAGVYSGRICGWPAAYVLFRPCAMGILRGVLGRAMRVWVRGRWVLRY